MGEVKPNEIPPCEGIHGDGHGSNGPCLNKDELRLKTDGKWRCIVCHRIYNELLFRDVKRKVG